MSHSIATGGFNDTVYKVSTMGFGEDSLSRFEKIMRETLKNLTGLDTTGENIERDTVYPPENMPFLALMQGADTKDDPSQINDVECTLDIQILVFLKGEKFTTLLNKIRAEIYSALMKSGRLGLDYVDAIVWIDDEAPEVSGDAETLVVKGASNYQIKYTHSLTNKRV